jgi:membrane associated rhomboid family serine protease
VSATRPLPPPVLDPVGDSRPRPSWRDNLERTLPLLVALVTVNFAVFALEAITAGSVRDTLSSSLVRDGGLDGPDVASGSWWRLVTSGFLHAGWNHFFGNMIALVVVGALLGGVLGAMRTAWVYAASLLGGAVAVLLFDPAGLTVGASGAIFGVAGAGLIVAWRQRRWVMGVFILAWVATNVAFTLSTPGVSLAGHAGGFLAGLAVGRALLTGDGRRLRSDAASIAIGGAAVAALVALALAVA